MENANKLHLESLADAQNHAGEKFGPGDWLEITQQMINDFADATGDHAWLHVDVERAKREMPDGKTIAHGLLTLCLTIKMFGGMVVNSGRGGGGRPLNYGYDHVRFISPVQVGARIRMRGEVLPAETKPQGVLVGFRVTIEIENRDKPAMVADWREFVFS